MDMGLIGKQEALTQIVKVWIGYTFFCALYTVILTVIRYSNVMVLVRQNLEFFCQNSYGNLPTGWSLSRLFIRRKYEYSRAKNNLL